MNKVSVYESFDHLPQSCKAFFDEASASSAFLSLSWFKLLSEALFQQNDPTLILSVESAEGRPCLVLPLWRTSEGRRLWRARALSSASNYYTPLFSPLVQQTNEGLRDTCRLVAQTIVDARPAWDVVNLQPMDPDSDVFSHLSDALRDAGMWVDSYFCFGNWYLEVGGRSYREYCKTLPSRLTNTLARKVKQANKAGRLQLAIIAGGAELGHGIAAYESVYNASWKIPEAYPAFMPGLIRLCAEQGILRLGIAYLDNQPVAAQVWIVSRGVASIYKLAYDQRFANLSVGSILTARLMEHVIDVDRVTEVDFLTGDDSYKRDWMSARRERHGIIAFNPRTLRGALGAFRHFGMRKLRRVYRSLVRPGSEQARPAQRDD